MQTKTLSSRIESLVALYDMQTKFFINVLNGISDKDAYDRLNTKANHIAWLAGTIVHQRYYMAMEAGSTLKQSGYELFKDNKGIQDDAIYPTQAQYKSDWEVISPVSRDALINLTDEKLDSVLDMGGMKMPFFDMVAFTIYREANCIGQIALWRRLLGYDAMKYE